MTRLDWNAPGERIFETGTDRGVLYPNNGDGVPWNGLVSVSENPTGGTATSRYLDGVNYLNELASEQFAGSLTAFTYPEEFAACDGTLVTDKGIGFSQQRRQPFGLTYRTLVGNDLEGTEKGYKLHLIFGAKATPTSKAFSSIKATADISNFTWNIITTPVLVPGLRPLAKLTIDSTKTDQYLLAALEDILYGTEEDAPRMPTLAEIKLLFEEWLTLVITDNGDGTWTATGPDDLFYFPPDEDGIFELTWPSVVATDENTFTISSL